MEVSKKDTKKGGVKMNKQRLESLMKLYGDTGQQLADYVGLSRSRFSCKINEKNGAEFTQSEIGRIKNKYSLSADDVDDIFFSNKVS